MFQVWRHVVFIYFFYKFSFFSKNLLQQQTKIQIDLKFFVVAETNFFRKKRCAAKEKYPGTLKIFSWNCNNLKISCNFMKKSEVVSATFLLLAFNSKQEPVKMFFISLQKLFLFSRKSNFRILDFQISWRHKMSKHKTRNTFYWITWEGNAVC